MVLVKYSASKRVRGSVGSVWGSFPLPPPPPPSANGTARGIKWSRAASAVTLSWRHRGDAIKREKDNKSEAFTHECHSSRTRVRKTRRYITLCTRFGTMLSVRSAVTLTLLLFFILVEYSEAMPAIDKDKERFLNNVNLVNDDGSIETALMNYLFTKQIVKRLRNQLDIGDLEHKRSFWKQCATNAVACFGK